MYEIPPFSFTYNLEKNTKSVFSITDLVFNKGDAILVCGPSGGGKSTFLKILKGIIPEFSAGEFKLIGQIKFNNGALDGEGFEKNLQLILYLFQNPFSQLIFPTTEEEFFFSMENMNFTNVEMKSQKDYFEKHFNLQALWGKATHKLSNGECQKLVFASMLAIRPEVLLLDEPTAFIDPNGRREFYQLLKWVKDDRLMIIVDHHVEEVLPLVNRIIEVDEHGEVKEISKENFLMRNSLSAKKFIQSFDQLAKKTSRIKQITIENLSYDYGNVPLLKNIVCNFQCGEVIAIKGDNGAGKSTLIKLMAGILKPKNGKVSLISSEGKNISHSLLEHIGFIFQNPETHFFFDTIEEELEFSLKKMSLNEKEKLINVFFHQLDLKKSPFMLSEGEKRRLSIILTVFDDKSLLFYDEPTFGQDADSKKIIIDLLKAIKTQDTIQIVISHDEEFIKSVADRVFELSGGSLIENKV